MVGERGDSERGKERARGESEKKANESSESRNVEIKRHRFLLIQDLISKRGFHRFGVNIPKVKGHFLPLTCLSGTDESTSKVMLYEFCQFASNPLLGNPLLFKCFDDYQTNQ